MLLAYRRRGGRWSANKILKFTVTAERKARAAVRCRRFVPPIAFRLRAIGFLLHSLITGALR